MPDSPSYVSAMPLLTADDLLRVDLPGMRVELVQGALVVREPPGYRHGAVTARLTYRLMRHVEPLGLGRVLAGDPGFRLATDPDTVRGPDVAFVAKHRDPDPAPTGFAALAPDLVIEVVSPADRPGDTLRKVADWLNAGTRLVWVVDPDRRVAWIHRADGSATVVGSDDALSGEDVVPGFVCPLSEVL